MEGLGIVELPTKKGGAKTDVESGLGEVVNDLLIMYLISWWCVDFP